MKRLTAKLLAVIMLIAVNHACAAMDSAPYFNPSQTSADHTDTGRDSPVHAKDTSDPKLNISVISSKENQISGGDARILIDLPPRADMESLKVLLNQEDVRQQLLPSGAGNRLGGLLTGLKLGENRLEVEVNTLKEGQHFETQKTLINHPIEGPIFSGPHQQPFVCQVQNEGLGQALVDNDSEGFTIFAEDEHGEPTDEVIGYSKLCSIHPLIVFKYLSTQGDWKDYTPGQQRPLDMAQTTTLTGKTVDYIIRWERGTINRFIYSIAMLSPAVQSVDKVDISAWNRKLIYYFQGGVGIGHEQGDTSNRRMLYKTGLGRGYAVAYSTGTRTGVHYNLELGAETALMVKEHFIERYGLPKYTVGVGGSGGGIQQYIYGEYHKGLLDGAIPQQSYPDMVTQAIHQLDCELLEFYMDVVDGANPFWQVWSNRRLLQGTNASDQVINPYTRAPGSTECVQDWRGLTPLVINPHYGRVPDQALIHPLSAVAAIQWTHFEDLVNILGRDEAGFARNFWDNTGVQYGLRSVADGDISGSQFIHLNTNIGGWKKTQDMVQEGSPFFPPGVINFDDWDPWSSRNQNLSPDSGITPASRNEGNEQAMQAAYDRGQVFRGHIDIPVIDWRPYLEPKLDMHHARASFAARQRIINARGHARNQLIWITDSDDTNEFDQTPEAFEVIDAWLDNILANPDKSIDENKPPRAKDRCFDTQGAEIASGDPVWDGVLNDKAPGVCTALFPVYDTSRTIAGGPFEQSLFKCAFKSVTRAIADGDYGVWQPTADEQAQLEKIFPMGVCDYSKPDQALDKD